MIKKLYARALYWLIRPALELRESRVDGEKWVVDVVLKDIRRNGPLGRVIRNVM